MTPCWTNHSGKEVPITRLDNNSIREILDKLYSLAVMIQEMTVGLYSSHKGAYFQTAASYKTDWREFADKIFFDFEYEAALRKLDWTPKPLTGEKKFNLMQRGALERYLVGALRDCIHAHGPITRDTAPSAAKRLIGSIKVFNRDQGKKL